jgi:hypothetical protein
VPAQAGPAADAYRSSRLKARPAWQCQTKVRFFQFAAKQKGSMTQPLRPMSLGEILDRTFQIYRARFFAFVAIAAIPISAMELIHAVDSILLHMDSFLRHGRTPGIYFYNLALSLLFYFTGLIIVLSMAPAAVKMTSDSLFKNECSIGSALRFAAVRWRSSLWIAILVATTGLLLPWFGFAGLTIGIALLAHIPGSPAWVSTLAHLLSNPLVSFVPWGILLWLGSCLSLVFPAATIEDILGVRSLRRGWTLTRGTRARICFVAAAIWAASWALSWSLEFLLGQLMLLTGNLLDLADTMRTLYTPAVFLLVSAIYAVLGPVFAIAITLFYYDQRIRREAYEVVRMMECAGLNSTSTSQPAETSTPQSNPEASEA